MKILICTTDIVSSARMQIMLATVSKDVVSAPSCADFQQLYHGFVGSRHGFDIMFMDEQVLSENRITPAEMNLLLNKEATESGVVVLTGDESLCTDLGTLPIKTCLLKKSFDYKALMHVLGVFGVSRNRLNCWEYKQCGREVGGILSDSQGVCPAALDEKNNGSHGGKNGGRSCWVVSGTLCDGDVQGSFAAKIKSCVECDFYQIVAVQEKEEFESINKTLQNLEHDLTKGSVSEGMFRVDHDAIITSFNLAAEKITGHKSLDLLGQPHHVLFASGADTQKKTPVAASLLSGKVHRSCSELIITRGKKVPVRLTCAPIIEDQVITGAVVLFKDITEELRIQRQKEKAEQDLRTLAETLEERVQQRTKQLNVANQDLLRSLSQLEQAQNQLVESEKMASLGGLVAGVAHEINTPVGIAYTAATHLEKETRQVVDLYNDNRMKRSDFVEYLSTCEEATRLLRSNINRASALISSFKQVAVDQSVERKRTFHFAEYLREVLLSLRPLLKNTPYKVAVDCDEEIEVSSFPGAFSQIFTNLITNSVVHGFDTVDSGNILITFRETSDRWDLTYRDDGKGIAGENIDRIFDPFFTTNRENGGTGLGMHIVYNLVSQKLNGTIVCESPAAGGTIFRIAIPRNSA